MGASKPTKLTLVVDPVVVRRAKSFATAHNTSVSSLVEAYLSQLTADDTLESIEVSEPLPPTTRELLGSLRTSESDSFDERGAKVQRLTSKYLHD